MNIVTVSLDTDWKGARERFKAAFKGKPQGNYISFASTELLWRTLAPKRLEILRMMVGAGPMSIREVARRVGRDVKGVHGDVRAVILAGVVDEGEGGISFPFDAIHVDFMLDPARRAPALA